MLAALSHPLADKKHDLEMYDVDLVEYHVQLHSLPSIKDQKPQDLHFSALCRLIMREKFNEHCSVEKKGILWNPSSTCFGSCLKINNSGNTETKAGAYLTVQTMPDPSFRQGFPVEYAVSACQI